MGQIGIIAEYNPFHNGHQYQIEQIRSHFPDKKIICIMSGNYVQRGEPSIYNKYLRAKCALLSGVDVLFELPTLFSTASAEYFATSAVLALAHTNVIDTLCFGAEDPSIDKFYTIANILLNEPSSYQSTLKKNLKKGLSYPKARSIALCEYLNDESYQSFLSSPNNILGIEYVKAIIKYKLNITPFIIKRNVSSYHDTTTENTICSATALRKGLIHHSVSDFEKNMPDSCVSCIINSKDGQPLLPKHFYPYIQYALWEHKNNYTEYADITNDLSNQLRSITQYPSSPDEFIDMLSNRNYTKSRIRHILLNILLGIKKQDILYEKEHGYLRYLRLLGFQTNASPVLRKMQNNSNLPIITKVGNAKKILSSEDFLFFQNDIDRSMLYHHIFHSVYQIRIEPEHKHSVIITK